MLPPGKNSSTGGFTAPKGALSRFGALLIGHYRGKELLFAAKVGTGFNEKMLADLHRKMIAHRAAKSPFSALPAHRGRWRAGFTKAELAHCTWVEPRPVAQVRFTEWTEDGVLRHPAFLGLRDDKSAREVVRET